ncbi:MAG TPA: SDR family oxidoreductase [Anaerolineales bacterium]
MVSENQFALITGGSSGIGLALARLLTQKGLNVWLIARRQQPLNDALSELEKLRRDPNQCCGGVVAADVSDPAQAERAVAQVVEAVGVPHLVVNSAGITQPGELMEQGADVFQRMMQVNYFGTVYITKAVLPGMVERHSGHIVNISSVAGYLGVYGYAAYSASKFAVRGFSDVLRTEVKHLGIRVSLVFPPDTDTPQLAFEQPYKPPVLKALEEGTKPMSAEAVAKAIWSGVQHNRYLILPGMQAKALFWLNGILGSAAYAVIDWQVADAIRKTEQRKNGKS